MSANKDSNAKESDKQTIPSAPSFTRLKILTMGSNATGKSCLVKRFCEERFVSKYIPTIGIDYGVKPIKIHQQPVRINFWDLSGFAEFLDIRNEFYKDSQGCVLVYDVTQRATFDELQSWIDEGKKYGADPLVLPTVLCANKCDKKRVVSEDEGKAFASKNGMTYYETSALSGNNVHEMFQFLFEAVLKTVIDG